MFLQLHLSCFTVKKVVVEGNELYDQKTMRMRCLMHSLLMELTVCLSEISGEKNKKIPFIDTMSISLDSPHTLHISVYEKGMLG